MPPEEDRATAIGSVHINSVKIGRLVPKIWSRTDKHTHRQTQYSGSGVIEELGWVREVDFYRAMLCVRGTSHGPVSVRLSVTSRSSAKTDERIELVFGVGASFHPSYTVLKGNSVISKNKGTSLWNFVLKSGLRKFRHGISIVETCYQLSSRKVDAHSVINWAVVGQLSR